MAWVVRVLSHRRFSLAKDVDELVAVEREAGYGADGCRANPWQNHLKIESRSPHAQHRPPTHSNQIIGDHSNTALLTLE